MSGLEKWLPFKFARRKSEQKEPQPIARTNDPFAMMHEMMRNFGTRDWMKPLFDESSFFGDFSGGRFVPAVDVVEEEDGVVVTAELPGLSQADVRLTVQDGVLVIGGEKRHEAENRENGCYRVERSFGSFSRTVPLPRGVDVDAAEAKLTHGVLTVRLPRTSEPGGARKIDVTAS